MKINNYVFAVSLETETGFFSGDLVVRLLCPGIGNPVVFVYRSDTLVLFDCFVVLSILPVTCGEKVDCS